jgi:bifunctional DNA-binding transcriptional regulator/antitoxin component of YhaV-PrlF toxin-antitoxin module
MHISTLTISSKGQLVLPKKVRDRLKSNLVSLEVNEYNQILITAVHDVGGALASYQKNTPLTFEEIRNQAWKDSITITEKESQ